MSRAGTQVDREAEISALGRALAVERRAKYIDFRGKRSTFSEFMRRTSDRLIKRFPQDLRWTTIRGLFRQYPNLDVASRMAIVRRTEDLLFGSRPVPTSEEPAQSPSQRYKSERPQLQREPEAFVPEPSSLYSKKTSTRSQSQQSITKASSRPGAIASSGPPGIAGVPPASFVNPAKNPKNPAAENNDPKSSVQSSAKSFEKDPRKVDVKFVRGVGPKIADLLGRLEIRTAEDLLRHYPREHLDFQNHLKIRDVTPGEDATILGTIRSVGAFQSKKGNVSILTISIHD